jgi:hypothetical protein
MTPEAAPEHDHEHDEDGWTVAAHADLDAALGGKKRPARVTTPAGSADGELSDVDPWGRYRLAGTSTPPFVVESAGELETAG